MHTVHTFPLIQDWRNWHLDLIDYLDGPARYRNQFDFRDPFFRRIAVPLRNAYFAHREEKDTARALWMLNDVADGSDWRSAATDWLHRRLTKKIKKG